jgi:hypothetical protein
MNISAELADLGTQLQQALVAAYQATAGARTILAFQPGIAVPSTLAQGGQVNQLQVTTWLGQVADAPLQLRTDQAAVVGGPPGSLGHMTEIYQDLVEFATPAAQPGTDQATRVAEEIANARAMAGGGGELPLGTSPGDWALPHPDYWTQFTYTESESDSSTGPPGSGRQRPPGIWTFLNKQALPPFEVWRSGTVNPGLLPREERPVLRGDGPPATELTGTTLPAAENPVTADDPVLRRFAVLPADPPPPPVKTLLTRLTLDHMLVMIDRSPWWRNDIVEDPAWYVAGLARGAWIGVPPSADTAYALPVALLLVQNLILSGSWSSDETTALTAPGMMLGPFGLGGARVSSTSDGSISISVPGMHLAGVFCQPLPVLPPSDPPAGSS